MIGVLAEYPNIVCLIFGTNETVCLKFVVQISSALYNNMDVNIMHRNN